jgi:hypothetical protein
MRNKMGDSYDDAEVAGAVDSTYCQKHKAGKGLWPHECPDCIKASKAKCARNRDNWKKRAEAAEAKLDWLMVQGIRGIAPGWVGIPEVEWDSTYPPNPRADRTRHLVTGTVEPVVQPLNQEP